MKTCSHCGGAVSGPEVSAFTKLCRCPPAAEACRGCGGAAAPCEDDCRLVAGGMPDPRPIAGGSWQCHGCGAHETTERASCSTCGRGRLQPASSAPSKNAEAAYFGAIADRLTDARTRALGTDRVVISWEDSAGILSLLLAADREPADAGREQELKEERSAVLWAASYLGSHADLAVAGHPANAGSHAVREIRRNAALLSALARRLLGGTDGRP